MSIEEVLSDLLRNKNELKKIVELKIFLKPKSHYSYTRLFQHSYQSAGPFLRVSVVGKDRYFRANTNSYMF